MGPTIILAADFVRNNPEIVETALKIIIAVAKEQFKGTTGENRAKFDVVVKESKNKYKKIHYDGPVDGMKDLLDAVKDLTDGHTNG